MYGKKEREGGRERNLRGKHRERIVLKNTESLSQKREPQKYT